MVEHNAVKFGFVIRLHQLTKFPWAEMQLADCYLWWWSQSRCSAVSLLVFGRINLISLALIINFLVNFSTCDVTHRMLPSHHHPHLRICAIYRKTLAMWLLRVLQVILPSIRCLMCHMTFADGSSIIAHYDTAHAPSLVRLHSSRLEWHISGTKFADSSSKRRHLRSANASFDVKRLQCNLCPTSLKPKSPFKNHENIPHLGIQTNWQMHAR